MDSRKRTVKGFALTWAGALALAVAFPALPRAEELVLPITTGETDGLFAGLAVVGDTELAALRGGFSLQGMQFEFGVNARTYVDGQLALETVFTLTDDSGPSIQSLPLSGTPDGTLAMNSGAPGTLSGNMDLSALAGANGLVLTDSKGTTGILHQVNRDQILSVLINSADGRVIQQEFDINVTVGGFKQFQQAVGSALLNSRIADAVNR